MDLPPLHFTVRHTPKVGTRLCNTSGHAMPNWNASGHVGEKLAPLAFLKGADKYTLAELGGIRREKNSLHVGECLPFPL